MIIMRAEIEVAKKLCEEATPGPWHAGPRFFGTIEGPEESTILGEADGRDLKFIAASRTLVPKLIKAVEKLSMVLRIIEEESRDDLAAGFAGGALQGIWGDDDDY